MAFISTGLLFFALGKLSARLLDPLHKRSPTAWAAVPKKVDTLVVYTYANRDWEYPRNIEFFIQHGEPKLDTESTTGAPESPPWFP